MESQRTEGRGTQAILIVEEDESIRRILDLSLRHAGFAVGLASTHEEALKRLADGPDLVIAGATDPDGLALCRRVKQTGDRLPPAVVLISEPGLESKTRGLEAGADDFVVKPIYVQEVVARARALLQRRERERLELSAHGTNGAAGTSEASEAPAPRTDRFVSDISDVPLVDLLRAIAAHQKSGVAVISADGGGRGEIFFRQGNVVDAEVGRLSGREAIYRLFCWSVGRLEVEWKSIRRKDTIEMRPQDLLMEALRRVDEWRRLLAGLPPLDTIFEVDYRMLAERLADIPDEVNRILRLFDGVRTFLQVIDDCGLPDLDAAASIGKLCQERIIHDIRLPIGEDEAVGADMEGWLSEATGPFRLPARRERDLFGASPEAGIGVHGRPTAPLEPLGDGASDPLDDDLRARFTDRLAAEGPAPGQTPGRGRAAASPTPGVPGFPTTLPGFGAAGEEQERATTAAMQAVSGAFESSLDAALSGNPELGGAGAIVESVLRPEVSSPNAEDAILSAEDATPIVDVTTLDEAPTVPGAEPPPPVAAALPIGPEKRSASGEIVVRPAKTKIKHSPAAEVRLAHLREEHARAFVRPSQSLTPPGSARALDEPPPLLDGPAPEPLQRPTTQLVRATAVEAAIDAADTSDEPPPPSRHTGALISAAVALAVVVIGGMWLASRHDKAADAAADEAAMHPAAPPPLVGAARRSSGTAGGRAGIERRRERQAGGRAHRGRGPLARRDGGAHLRSQAGARAPRRGTGAAGRLPHVVSGGADEGRRGRLHGGARRQSRLRGGERIPRARAAQPQPPPRIAGRGRARHQAQPEVGRRLRRHRWHPPGRRRDGRRPARVPALSRARAAR